MGCSRVGIDVSFSDIYIIMCLVVLYTNILGFVVSLTPVLYILWIFQVCFSVANISLATVN